MKRVTVFRNGSLEHGVVLAVEDSLEDLLSEAGRKLDIDAEALYSRLGGLIGDISLIRDDDVLFVADSESFKPIPSKKNEPDFTNTTAQGPPMGGYDLKVVNNKEWVTLNVGGRYFTTTRSTLMKEPDSMLARMFFRSESHVWDSAVDSNGAFLVDRSPAYFEPILNYLRHGELVIDKGINSQGVLEEAKFFGVESLIELLEARIQDEQPPTDLTPISRREFILRLMNTPSNCELRCQGLNFAGSNLTKLDLRYINFKYAIMRGSNLCGANLSYCNLERADMSGCKMDGANLLGAKMLCVNLEGASLQGCNFEDPAGSRTNMEGANMKFVNLEGSHMAGVNLRVATLKNANLQNCDLRSAVLAGADLENCDLSGCDLHEANLRGANLKGAAFELMLNPLHMSQTVP